MFLSISTIGFSLEVPAEPPNEIIEDAYKGLVVYKPSHKDVQELLSVDETEIDNIAKQYEGKIGWKSAKYSHFYVDAPKENYSEIVKNLKENGYEVRDELIYRPYDSDSLQAIGAPYQCRDVNNTKFNLEGKNRKIGIIDSGIDPNHPDFRNRIDGWRDSVEIIENGNTTSTVPYDDYGHGTEVASVAAGDGSAYYGIYKGVATLANITVARVSGPDGKYKERYIEDAITWMIGQNVDSMTMSFGTDTTNENICTDTNAGINVAIKDAINHGIFMIAAAGNEGPLKSLVMHNNGAVGYEPLYIHPACIDDVISVGLTYKSGYASQESGVDRKNVLWYSAGIHLIIEVNGLKEKEYDWEAFNGETEDYLMKDGLDIIIKPNVIGDADLNYIVNQMDLDLCNAYLYKNWADCDWNHDSNVTEADIAIVVANMGKTPWPATVKLKFEGVDRVLSYDPIFGWRTPRENWWPGNSSKGDSFWESQYVFNSGEKIAIQFSAWPVSAVTTNPGITYYHNYFYRPELDDPVQIKYHNIWFYVFNTSRWDQNLKDTVTYYSCRGYDIGDYYPDVVAPGYMICAANSSQRKNYKEEDACTNSNYVAVEGSSFAAPHVAGLVALLKEANPFATYDEIKDAVLETANLIYSDSWKSPYYFVWNSMGRGRINATSAARNILHWDDLRSGGYADSITDPQACYNFNYVLHSSANQMRDYYKQCPYPNYDCEVDYDSIISNVCINGVCDSATPSISDVFVRNNSNIEVEFEVNNVGKYAQRNWYVGVEFWRVSNFSNPTGTKDKRVNVFYNNKDGSHGCIEDPDPAHGPRGSCPIGVDCKIISESNPDSNHQLDVGETIKLKCSAPASFYPISNYHYTGWCNSCGSGNGVMVWVHERDLGQDANNDGDTDGDGNVGDWWWDALSWVNPVKVKAAIVSSIDSDGGKNYLSNSFCKDSRKTNYDSCLCLGYGGAWIRCLTSYGTKAACEADPECFWGLTEYWPAGEFCDSCFKDCRDLGSNYFCSSGRCTSFIGSITSLINNNNYTKDYIPLTFTFDRPIIWTGYSIDARPNVTVTGPVNITGLSDGLHNIVVYAKDNSGNIGSSDTVYFSYCPADTNGDKKIDLKDVFFVGKLYGKPALYDNRADFNDDGKIDLKDYYLASQRFGKETCSFVRY